MNKILIKLSVTVLALTLFGVRVVWPNLEIDAIALGLLVLAVLPWFAWIIEAVELPGGVKISLREVESAGEKIGVAPASEDAAPPVVREPPFLEIAGRDPNLALVGLRIEIDRRLRRLTESYGSSGSGPLSTIIEELVAKGALDEQTASGLGDLVRAGNEAAHGAKVDSEIARWAVEEAPRILAVVDAELARSETADVYQWLERALTIIQFQGEAFRDTARLLLYAAKRDRGRITLAQGETGLKDDARSMLEKLGALEEVGDDLSPRWGTHYRLTALGTALLSQLSASPGRFAAEETA